MFYLKNEKDIKNIKGFLNYPNIRKKKTIELTEENEIDLLKIIENIEDIINKPIPTPKKSRICSKCAYFEFCFS